MNAEELLRFEARWPRHTAAKERAITHELGLSAARYYLALIRASSSLEGIKADPITARQVRDRPARRLPEFARNLP